MKPTPRVLQANASTAPLAALTAEAAAQAMWLFYRDHKLQLIADIKTYRAGILAQLMAGVAVEVVFAPYFRPAEPAKSMRRAA